MNGNTCGCKSCGGAQTRNDTILARRVVAYAPFVLARRGQTAASLANRRVAPTLYSALAVRAGGLNR